MTQTYNVTVNGHSHQLEAEPDTPLLHILRTDLRLTGSRFGCGAGSCGACMVLLDGHPTPSCDLPVWAAEGKSVVTVEGLVAADGTLHPVQQAFLDEQAGQCGYCVSGIIVTAAALLEGDSDPDATEIATALDRHLCRCGIHQRAVRAVLGARASNPGVS